MARIFTYIFCLAILASLGACLDQIELSIPSGLENSLVIQAKLVKGAPHTIEVKLSRLYNFQNASYATISANRVSLIHENGQQIDIRRIGSGLFKADIPADNPEFPIDYYTKCLLEVELDDGRRFISTPEQLLPLPKIDTVYYNLGQFYKVDPTDKDAFKQDTFVRFFMDIPLTPAGSTQKSRFRVDLLRTFKLTEGELPLNLDEIRSTCYITQNTGVIKPIIVDGKTYPSDYLDDFFFYKEQIDLYYFIEGYYLQIITESLSDGAFRYYDEITKSVDRNGNMLEPPAGEIYTNFYNPENEKDPVHGYFYMVEQDTLRKYVPPSFLNYQDTFCVLPDRMECLLTTTPCVCMDCTLEKNSSLIPPVWWKDE